MFEHKQILPTNKHNHLNVTVKNETKHNSSTSCLLYRKLFKPNSYIFSLCELSAVREVISRYIKKVLQTQEQQELKKLFKIEVCCTPKVDDKGKKDSQGHNFLL